jgi:hypothetical protein
VLKLDTPSAPQPPAEPTPEPNMDFGSGNEEPAPSDDKPFDDEPFDAGVDADEESDPKKFIEQLTGKLGQSLRTYNDEQGGPDFELEKFAINSLLSATHTSEMDAEDQEDIIKKVKTAGDTNKDDNEDNTQDTELSGVDGDLGDDSPDIGGDSDFGGGEGGGVGENILGEKENGFLVKPKKLSIFAPEGSEESNFKNKIVDKLHETFNQEDMNIEPMVEPIVKPSVNPSIKPEVKPNIAPSRKNKPFLPMPDVNPDPKAINK